MKNQTLVSRQGQGTEAKLLLLYVFKFITLLTKSCDGNHGITPAMFEIKEDDHKLYMLKDCRKMAADDIDCKCVHLDRECQQVDVENCTNCSCFHNQSKRIFYIKKRYGALCLSPNNLFNACKYYRVILVVSYELTARNK